MRDPAQTNSPSLFPLLQDEGPVLQKASPCGRRDTVILPNLPRLPQSRQSQVRCGVPPSRPRPGLLESARQGVQGCAEGEVARFLPMGFRLLETRTEAIIWMTYCSEPLFVGF